MNYAEFSISPTGLVLTKGSKWECRNTGLLKIMTRVMENLLHRDLLKDRYTVRINTADGPTRDRRPNDRNFMEFDTGVDGLNDEGIFPDYVFGNWWHIGLVDYDEFVRDICESNSHDRIEDDRLFWIGNLQGIQQRIKYVELSRSHPERLLSEVMHWTNGGSRPTKFVPTKDYCRFRYLIDLTGQACSGRLKLLPFCNRPLFITDRRFWSWSDIEILKQGLHIPVREDLGDLLERLDWARENWSVASGNSESLLNFCRRELTFGKACERATRLVSEAIGNIRSVVRPTKKIKVDLVVAHYREGLSWIEKVDDERIRRIFVYTKGEKPPALKNGKVVNMRLENVGRESHTYLRHCVDQYEAMKGGSTDFVFFLQGNPHGMDDKRVSEWIDCVAENNLKHTLNFRISSPFDFLNNGRCRTWAGATEPAAFDVKGWCEEFVRADAKFDEVPIFWNACFGVSVDRILSNPPEKYRRIAEKELSSINPECGHYCERLWYYIFNMDEAGDKVVLDDFYEFWGGADGRKHYGTVRLKLDGSIGLYSHQNESFWRSEGESIVIMDRSRKTTSILNKVREGEYEGHFLGAGKSLHRLVSLAGRSPIPR